MDSNSKLCASPYPRLRWLSDCANSLPGPQLHQSAEKPGRGQPCFLATGFPLSRLWTSGALLRSIPGIREQLQASWLLPGWAAQTGSNPQTKPIFQSRDSVLSPLSLKSLAVLTEQENYQLIWANVIMKPKSWRLPPSLCCSAHHRSPPERKATVDVWGRIKQASGS